MNNNLDHDSSSDEEGIEDDEEASLIDGEGRKTSAGAKRPWDSFRDIPHKLQSGSQTSIAVIEYSKRILKFLAYVISFAAVLGAGVLAKTLMLLVVAQISPPSPRYVCITKKLTVTVDEDSIDERVLWTWVLFLIACMPEVAIFFRAGRIVFFKNNNFPKFLHFATLLLTETLHVIGVAILIFEVLPQLDAIRGALLTNAVCLVPAVLLLLTRGQVAYGKFRWVLDCLAILMQLTAFVVWPVVDNSPRLFLMAPAVFLASFGWWMNFVPQTPPTSDGLLPGILRSLSNIRHGIKEDTLYWTYLFICVWKVIIFFSVMLIIIEVQGYMDVATFFNHTVDAFSEHGILGKQSAVIAARTLVIFEAEGYTIWTADLAWLYILLVQAFCAYSCYAFSKFACKILIQKVGMALPSILIVPCTVAFIVILNEYKNGEDGDLCFMTDVIPNYMNWNVNMDQGFITDKAVWIWVFWLVSQVYITSHIWSPMVERLARTEKLFVTPMFSSILLDQSICLNRAVEEEPIEDTSGQNNDDDADDDEITPHVIACATMWHESKEEMVGFLKSIVRLDLDQCVRKAAKKNLKTRASKRNYYTFETHIFFDDVFELEDEGGDDYVLNPFVRDLLLAIPESVREVHRSNVIKVDPPEKIPTPYGGRLVFTLPGRNKINVHLKDKNKIRHRKRWSQCMYMYYLLGYRLMDQEKRGPDIKEKIAQNTFLLALDGDIDFLPKSVLLLVDLMKKNPNLGAACGRIHPVGAGLMAWYQIFEYAIGHWLQKATEHVIGCVLCSPGCFSLFRGKALMDDNVMKTYTKNCDVARHYVQYDQGEDRWLCTLLLQRGYRVEYSAASDAYTHCPETFNEFYNQRRRWVPSTMANILDLLGSYKLTIEVNSNISLPYILYQTMLMAGTVLGPGTIFLMLVGAFNAAFKIDNWTAFLYNLVPIVVYIIVCLFLSSKIQLGFALIVSTIYAIVMMAVLVGVLLQIYQDGPLAPSTLFLFIVAGEMIIAAFMHPEELYCLPSGAIYYITIPSMYLLLIIYSVCNLNVVSWGTREVATKKTKAELEEEKKAVESVKKKAGSDNAILSFLENFAPGNIKEKGSMEFSFAGLFRCMFCTQPQDFDEREHLIRIGDSLVGVKEKLDNIERHIDPTASVPQSRRVTLAARNSVGGKYLGRISVGRSSIGGDMSSVKDDEFSESADMDIIERDDLLNPYWIEDDCLKKAKMNFLPTEEKKFWFEMIERYLKPIDEDKEKKKKIEGDLRDLRDKMVLAFFMLNALFVTIIFLLQLNKDTIFLNWPLGVKSNITFDPLSLEVAVTQSFLQLEPIGLTFVIFFAFILIIQFYGMFLHRFETLCHVLSTTDVLISEESAFNLEKTIESAKKEASKADPVDRIDDDPVSRRKTIQNIENESNTGHRKSVKLDQVFNKYFEKVDKEQKEEADKRQSTTSNRFSRHLGGFARKSMGPPKRVSFMPQQNAGFDTITEE